MAAATGTAQTDEAQSLKHLRDIAQTGCALLARCETEGAKTKAVQTALTKLRSKLSAVAEAAHSEVQRVGNEQPTHALWLDRGAAQTLA